MRLEIAANRTAQTTDKGNLLEEFAATFMRAQGYKVISQIRLTGSELDLLCEHQVSSRQVYVECKAHRDALDANVIKNLEGTRSLNGYDEAWLLSSGPLGKEAKGLQHVIESAKGNERRTSIYTPDRVIEAFISAGVVKEPPQAAAIAIIQNEELLGEWNLAVTSIGRFWLVSRLKGGLPAGVIAFYAESGRLVDDPALLEGLAST